MIQKARNYIANYNEWLYMFFVLSIFGLMSIGQGSEYLIYRIVFPFSMLAFALKFVSTDYTKREWFWMILVGGLLFVNLVHNHEKTLVLSFLAVIGAKNVDFERLFKWALWERVVLTIVTVTLALIGVTENIFVGAMPKFMHGEWNYIDLYCYGYKHPNHAYLECFTIAVLFIVVYFNKMKWYMYVLLTAFMYGAYKVLVCRAGWLTWLVTLFIIIGYYIFKKLNWKAIYLWGLSAIPIILTLFSLWAICISGDPENPIGVKLNELFTGRMNIARSASYPQIFWTFLGHSPRAGMDFAYAHMIYNYGWIIFLIILIAYTRTMWRMVKLEKDGWCIALAVMSGYMLGEVPPLNVGWNITLVMLSIVLFDLDERLKYEKLQHEE